MSGQVIDQMNEQDRKNGESHDPGDMRRRQRGKNIVLGLVLAGFVVLFYVVSIVKMSGN